MVLKAGGLLDFTPLGYAAGDTNLYRFVGNDPTGMTDPTGLAGVGHHWVPVSVLTDAALSPWLSLDAYYMGMGATSGPTNPGHNFGTYGGVTHAEYNKVIKEELSQLVKKNGGKCISPSQMTGFINNPKSGLDHLGSPNAKIKAFNDAIAAERGAYLAGGPGRGFRVDQTPDQWVKQGKGYLEGPGAGRVGPGGRAAIKGVLIISAVAGWVVYDTPQALAVAGDSKNFKLAVQALSEGNIPRAERYFFGTGNDYQSNCFTQELIDKVDPKYGLLFESAMQEQIRKIDQQTGGTYMRYPTPGGR